MWAKCGPNAGQMRALFSHKSRSREHPLGVKIIAKALQIYANQIQFTQGKDPKNNRSRRVRIHLELIRFHNGPGGFGQRIQVGPLLYLVSHEYESRIELSPENGSKWVWIPDQVGTDPSSLVYCPLTYITISGDKPQKITITTTVTIMRLESLVLTAKCWPYFFAFVT